MTPETKEQKAVLRIALILNIMMFVVGLIAGIIAQSSGLLADALDMLVDAVAYAIALVAMTKGDIFKSQAAKMSGFMLFILGLIVIADVGRRMFLGSEPASVVIISVATLSLVVNSTVLNMLNKHKKQGVHITATWLFTRADVVINIGVILSGLIIMFTHFRYIDLIIGFAIGLFVLKEASEILSPNKTSTR